MVKNLSIVHYKSIETKNIKALLATGVRLMKVYVLWSAATKSQGTTDMQNLHSQRQKPGGVGLRESRKSESTDS